MQIPGVADLVAERVAVIETLDSLTDDEFESGPTLCAEWAPRDVLAHLMGADTALHRYLFAMGNVAKANRQIVEQARSQSRSRLMHRAHHWARKVPPTTQLAAVFLLGDIAMHHQDILRGLGRTRAIPQASRDAIFREGIALGPKRWIRYHVEPTDGGFAFGLGPTVRGSLEALGLWLAGRDGIEPELEFEGFLAAPARDGESSAVVADTP